MCVPIVARLRTEWRRWKGQASGRPTRRRASSRKLQVEGLEGRALLTAVYVANHGGIERSAAAIFDGSAQVVGERESHRVTPYSIELNDLTTVDVSWDIARGEYSHNPFFPRIQNLKPSALARTASAPLIEPPKYRHSVTAFQGLDLRVTILFVTRKSASYLL